MGYQLAVKVLGIVIDHFAYWLAQMILRRVWPRLRWGVRRAGRTTWKLLRSSLSWLRSALPSARGGAGVTA